MKVKRTKNVVEPGLPNRLYTIFLSASPKNINMGTDSDTDKTDPNEQDLGLAQFSPEVLEFMLGVVRARNSRQNTNTIPESDEAIAPG